MRKEIFSQAKWIWIHGENKPDEYAEFVFEFDGDDSAYQIFVTGDSNYNVYLNGNLVGFGQPTDYPHYKIYDEFPLSCVKAGKNVVKIVVWYYGIDTQAYLKDDAGTIFELRKNGETIYASNEETQGRLCVEYENYRKRDITVQLGLGYKYIAKAKNDLPFTNCVVRNKGRNFVLRQTERLFLEERVPVSITRKEDSWIVDMGEETVGFLDLDIESDAPTTVTVAYGEYLTENGDVVRHLNGQSDFSADIQVGKGRTTYTNYFRRFAGRYLQVFADTNLTLHYVGLRPTTYPLQAECRNYKSEIRNRIYKTSVKTLLSCMHEHYEDCPWREQALYNIDSRNEMLCTYDAFNDYKFARANLVLMTKGLRKDGLLSICFPAGRDIPIPSFSMIYPVQVYEYIQHSGDKSILDETFSTAETIMNTFISRLDKEKHLIADFPYPYWNFYEWSEGSNNTDQIGRLPDAKYPTKYTLLLNAEFLFVLGYYKKLCQMVGKTFHFDETALRKAIVDTFYDEKLGLFKAVDSGEPYYTTLGNSYALLCGLAGKELAEKLIKGEHLVPITLSMNIYLYDALLALDKQYMHFIIADLDKKYGRMLEKGATTFWETERGAEDQGHTGSLCHGWAAMPIYYYKLLNGKDYFNGAL